MSMIDEFPPAWTTPVTLLRSGGRDPKGNPRPDQQIPIPRALVGWRGTSDPVDRSDMTADTAVLYLDPGIEVQSTDRVVVPAGPWPHGTWEVDGSAKPWPLGTEVPLRRG